ncbi:NAD-binding protein [Streptomyces sp. NPDC056773]|uniref:NAD-binding protein n=1 Tax=unclassified Streptomyces TaxID=2593676 RepID=UPI0036C5CF39
MTQSGLNPPPVIVCGDDALAVRLAGELHDIYRQPVTLLLPDADTIGPQPPATTHVVEADTADAAALREAGVARAAALALVYEDDEANIRAALTAHRINPRVRLVIRLYNRKLGRYLAELLDQAAVVAGGQVGESAITVLSDADTAAPALAATVVAGTSKVLQADGLLFRAIERTPRQRREASEPALCTLALLSSTTEDPAGTDGTDASGPAGPRLLAHSAYITLLDLFSINDPAVEDTVERQLLQLFTGLVGLLLLPVLVAAVLEASGSFRSASALRRPPRGTADHIVLLGLGKIGTRVLARLRELDIPVVCVEEDPEARGIPLARSLRVPVILGDVTQDGILEAARIHRAHALLALTSSDTTNLEAILCARTIDPDLRVALRLYDDEFATAVHRTLRAAHPEAVTRSRSVTSLAAPAFAAAMMGRQILGALPVERRVLLFAAIDVAGVPHLDGRTIADTTRPGHWRVLALDTTDPADRRPDLRATRLDGQAHVSGLLFDLHPGHVLGPDDRVVIAATRQGLAQLLDSGP